MYKAGKRIIFWDFVLRENHFSYYFNLIQIIKLEYIIKGVTSDRHGGLVSALKSILPSDIPHQHCLVHLQRLCQSLLTKNPKTKAGTELLELVRFLNKINNHYEKNIWLKWFERLEKRYEDLIKARTYFKNGEERLTWWYTHKNLRRTFRTITRSKDNLFLYLDYSKLPKDINGLEGEFSHLKTKLSIHRGLKRERKANFVKWYFYFKSISKND
ncbi:transposase [Candidatus Microgenomates bacterium]|nr:transposase [Candidatus Microgenomates bacterium]